MSSGNNDNTNNIKDVLLIVKIRIITKTKQKIITITMMLIWKIDKTVKSKPSSKNDSAIYMASSITITRRSYFQEKRKEAIQYTTEY